MVFNSVFSVAINLEFTSIATSAGIDGKLQVMSPDKLPEIDNDRIACQQILAEDHSVFSIQWLVIPQGITAELTSDRLLRLYLDYIERFTLGLIRSVTAEEGVEFRLGGSSLAIIKFSPPISEKTADGEKSTLRISGGLLVQPKECARGQLDFMIESLDAGSRVTLKLSDYCPLILGSSRPSLWRKWLYRLTQAYLHKTVTIRFLAMVYRQATGNRLKKDVVRIAVRKGKET